MNRNTPCLCTMLCISRIHNSRNILNHSNINIHNNSIQFLSMLLQTNNRIILNIIANNKSLNNMQILSNNMQILTSINNLLHNNYSQVIKTNNFNRNLTSQCKHSLASPNLLSQILFLSNSH